MGEGRDVAVSNAKAIQSIKDFSDSLRRLPRVIAQEIAARAAPELTALSKRTFDAGEDPYGVAWAPGKDGHRVTLHKTGALESFIRYVAIGTKLRVALGVPYAKYQIGKRPVFPRQAGVLPVEWVETLKRLAVDVVREAIRPR